MNILAKVRKDLMTAGMSEAEVLADDNGVKAMFKQIQDLKKEMNTAKKAAAEEAARPYLEAIDKIERRYALYMKLSAR